MPKKILLKDGTVIDETEELSFMAIRQLSFLIQAGWSFRGKESGYITILNPSSGIKFRCRVDAGNDLAQLKSVFVEKVYGENFSEKSVLDVGMYNADSSIYFASKGAKIVVGIEPYVESFELACENIRLNMMEKRIKPLNIALSNAKGTASMRVSSNAVEANSLNPVSIVQRHTDFDVDTIVQTMTLEDIMATYDMERIDVLKMNCEGCEYDILGGIKRQILERINEIVLEFHDGVKGISEILENDGFEVDVRMLNERMGFLYAKRNTVLKPIYQSNAK